MKVTGRMQHKNKNVKKRTKTTTNKNHQQHKLCLSKNKERKKIWGGGAGKKKREKKKKKSKPVASVYCSCTTIITVQEHSKWFYSIRRYYHRNHSGPVSDPQKVRAQLSSHNRRYQREPRHYVVFRSVELYPPPPPTPPAAAYCASRLFNGTPNAPRGTHSASTLPGVYS